MAMKPTYEELKQRVKELEQESARLKQAEEEIKHRLAYESALSQISTMAVQAEDIKKFQDESLAIIGETMGVSRAYIFEHHHEMDTMENTVEWCSPEVLPQKDHLQSVPAGDIPWWVATLKEGIIICFSDIEDIPDEGAKEILRPQGILSILVAPMFVAGRYYGFIGFDECYRHRKWPAEDVEILLAMYRIIAGVIERQQAEKDRDNLQAQLNQAQKMESIGTLAGGIAHNFNNVLMGIQGRASLMMMDKDPSHPDYEHLMGIERCVKGAADLTGNLLGFARGGKYEVKPTELNALINRETRMFASTKKEIRVHEKYAENLQTVEVDQGQIRQALLNLYVNAWQAMPGGGDLYIQTDNIILGREDIISYGIAPGKYVKISVTDTGIGLDDAIREKIFDPFFSTKGLDQNFGLGLASVYGIIKNHGGFINVCSDKGKVTTFTIYLPASGKEVVEESSEPLRHDIRFGRGTVLLVDDEDMIVDVARKGLERLGYRVIAAVSGKEALDIYEKQKDEIDLVILDMIMPGMGGGEAFDRLKKMNGKVKVLLSSGYCINGQAREILNRGCSDFIQKPFTLEELSSKVQEVFSR